MFTGALVLNVFAAGWCIAGLLSFGAPSWLCGLPVVLSAALISIAWRASRFVAPRTPQDEKRIGRLIGLWSAVEGVGVFLAINLLRNLRLDGEIAPALAIIVGLHFLPLARGMPLPLYYATGSALLALGMAGFLIAPLPGIAVTCVGSGTVLWATSALLSARAFALRPQPG